MRLAPKSFCNLLSRKPGISNDKDPAVPIGAKQSVANICNQIKLPDAGGKLNQSSIGIAMCEKTLLDCRCYLRLQRVQTYIAGGFAGISPYWWLLITNT